MCGCPRSQRGSVYCLSSNAGCWAAAYSASTLASRSNRETSLTSAPIQAPIMRDMGFAVDTAETNYPRSNVRWLRII